MPFQRAHDLGIARCVAALASRREAVVTHDSHRAAKPRSEIHRVLHIENPPRALRRYQPRAEQQRDAVQRYRVHELAEHVVGAKIV